MKRFARFLLELFVGVVISALVLAIGAFVVGGGCK